MYDEALFLERRAESKENPGCCLDVICSSKNGRFKEALKLYEKSAEKYKMCNQFRKAGEIYEKCAEINIRLKKDPCNYYKDSIYCYQLSKSDYNVQKISAKLNNYSEKNEKK